MWIRSRGSSRTPGSWRRAGPCLDRVEAAAVGLPGRSVVACRLPASAYPLDAETAGRAKAQRCCPGYPGTSGSRPFPDLAEF